MATITKLKTNFAPIKQQSASHKRKMHRQRICSYGVGTISLVLMGLSLSHLAGGIQLLTGCGTYAAWAMAMGIDLGFISLELSQLCAVSPALRATVTRFAGPAVKVTLAVSALINAYQFAAGSPNQIFGVAAAMLGVSIPALIYVLTRVFVAMWIDGEK